MSEKIVLFTTIFHSIMEKVYLILSSFEIRNAILMNRKENKKRLKKHCYVNNKLTYYKSCIYF